MALSANQIAAVKYYEGDVSGNDPFWGDDRAYVTLNSLFYPGIDTERRRAAEGKRLNPAIVADPQRLLDLCVSLVSACRAVDLSHPRVGYRVERHADYLDMRKAGQTISFTSTSTAGFLPAYGDRIGIALLEFHIPAGVPCLPFGEVLHNDYAKSNEQEIMLPPGLQLEFEDVPIEAEERTIADAQGNPPIAKCQVLVQAPDCSDMTSQPIPSEEPMNTSSALEGVRAAERVYEALNGGCELLDEDVERYCTWKRSLVADVISASFFNRGYLGS